MDNVAVWNPSANTATIKKNETYLIDPNDFMDVLTLSPYTVFRRGQLVEISGMRLFALLTMSKPTEPKRQFARRSKRNICLKACADGSQTLHKSLTGLKLPLCIAKIMAELSNASVPRGGMYRKRFEFNCYLGNVLTCTKCKSACLIGALLHFYKMDAKCVGEVTHLLIKSQDVYKPSNCAKMKSMKLCPQANMCKGLNPICNF
ncbi:LEF-2 [Epiphyas postvittana nucleopolyhedrovirus]|uniref:LEF-2 n=1 Tax=Epiphyas postvittana nucleopolyhedrovirus TaxID=70600 RepID=Q91GP3_NPVEP|nr:LEF-2 [Epiphyas postvittana nucleopolyhedrovirus]AAK85568.1 LEF-2 [Epiphyas postvittana nucleopolyhedrovirus]